MKTPLMMIINPAAGKGGFKRSLPDALRLLSDTGYAVSLFFTECRGHATELATQYAGAFPYLLVLGGDGTLAEAIAGLMPLAERPKVGYIPIGTANDVARTIGLPKNDILAGAQHFIGGTPHEFDEGRRDEDTSTMSQPSARSPRSATQLRRRPRSSLARRRICWVRSRAFQRSKAAM